MRFKTRGERPLGAIATLFVSLALTTLLHLASAAPQQLVSNGLARRASGDDPGLGIELEMGQISLENNAKDWTPEDREKLKGAEMIPIDFAGDKKTNWKLTAETGGAGINVFPEAIVDGLKNKVGEKKTKGIGEEIFKFFKEWAPCRTKECKVNIKGMDKFNPWIVKWPKDEPRDPAKFTFSPQVTTPMPLEGLLEILSDTKEEKENPLVSKETRNSNKIKILKKDNFKPFSKIKSEDITDEFLGYFSLLTSYCVVAKYNDPKEGPKRSLPVMPRTDFVAQYIQFVEKKLEDQFCDGKTSLYDIIQKVSGVDKVAGEKFRWTPGIKRNIDEKWKGMEDDLKEGTLEVEKFLNYIQGYDKKADKPLDQMDLVKLMDRSTRHGQIGGLNDRMENVLGTDKPAAIFEFRDLALAIGNELSDTMESYENKVIDYHKKAPKKRSLDVREESNRDCKSKKKKVMCVPGQVLKVTGESCEACPKGEKPNAKGDKCEKDHGH